MDARGQMVGVGGGTFRMTRAIGRLNETAKVLDHMAGYLEREKVDLLLVSGDVFDAPNPGAEAEALVFGFFRRLGAKTIPAVVIAGNHDSPGRLDACGQLAELAGIRIIGRPQCASKGGLVEVTTPAREKVLVAALPFAAPGASSRPWNLPKTRHSPSHCMPTGSNRLWPICPADFVQAT
jgi:exonuclease SbcD